MQAQEPKPDSLIRKIFATLQAKDENAFLSLCPDSAQLVRIMKKIEQNTINEFEAEEKAWRKRSKNYSRGSVASSNKTDSTLRSILQKRYSPEGIQRIKKMFVEEFRFMIEKGEKRGIDWQAATLTNFTFDSIKPGQQNNHSFFERSGYPSVHGIIHFKEGDSAYQMSFSDVLYLPEEKGWYGAFLEKLVREGEPLESDHEGEEVREVVVQNIVVDLPPPPPPPLKSKKKRNTSAKKKRPPKL